MADFECNPVCRERGKLHEELGFLGFRSEPVQYPPMPSTATLQERVNLIRAAVLEGCKVSVTPADVGTVSRTVLLPCFKTPFFSGLGLAQELAELLALDDIRRMRGTSASRIA